MPTKRKFTAPMNNPNHENKTALVTGGNRGIGAAIARQFARAGYTVAITYRSGQDEANETVRQIAEETRQPVHAVQLDLEQEDTIAPVVEEAIETLGGHLDALVNNAGYADMSGPAFTAISRATLARTVNTNIVGPFLVTQAAVPRMRRGGAIINIGSCLASHVPAAGFSSYATSKAAITGFTRGLARDLGEAGIRVNEIAPGSINTDMNPQDGPSADFQRSTTILGRYGDPAEIARTAVFLASDEASYITGASLAVDGGTNV